MRSLTLLVLLLAVVAVGCVPPPSASEPASPNASSGQAPASTSAAAPAASPATSAQAVTSSIPGAAPQTAPPAQPTERVEAKAGVAKKGRNLDNETGIVVEPVKQLFAFQEESVFDLQIKPALNLYKASNGSFPKSHEEFMAKIIKANNIKLPELPAGQRYVYDPKTGKLMVERPAK